MVSKKTKLREFEDYLYSNLDEIMIETGDATIAGYRVAMTIATHSSIIDPLRLEIYTSKLARIKPEVQQAISWFAGAGFLVVNDLDSPYMEGENFRAGVKARANNSDFYQTTKKNIDDFREAFWSEAW